MAWVLIMEDEPQVRALAEEMLTQAGHRTLSAASVAEALALVRTYYLIDVLFTDGGPTGLDLAREAVALHPRLKVLYTSGGDVSDATKALFVEGAAFLPKPYTSKQLNDAIAALLANEGQLAPRR